MSTLQTDTFRFIHVKKCGGSFCHTVIEKLGIHFTPTEEPHCHSGWEWGDQSLPSFAFIRDPFTWYASMYSWQKEQGWKHYPDCWGMDFDEWLDFQIATEPYCEVKLAAIGYPSRVTYLGRFHHLRHDLAEALIRFTDLAKEAILEVILETPVINESNSRAIILTPEQRNRISRSEMTLLSG